MGDQWCEQRMWRSVNIETNGVDPLCVISGVVISIIPFWFPAVKPQIPILFVHAGLIFLGAGTVAFHSIRDIQSWVTININSFDIFPIIFVTSSLFFMFIHPVFDYFDDQSNLVIVTLFLAWPGLLTLSTAYLTKTGIDNALGHILNVNELINTLMVTPLAVSLFVYTCMGYGSELLWVWIYAIVGMICFLLNTYLCELAPILSVLHALWHVTITMAIWGAARVANDIQNKV